jgi:hypothetical protein
VKVPATHTVDVTTAAGAVYPISVGR